MLHAFHMQVPCRHAYILFGLPRQMGRLDAGNPPFNRNLIRALPHRTHWSANATPSAVKLTHLDKMENSWDTDNERDRPFQTGSSRSVIVMEGLSVWQENQRTFLAKECLGWLMHVLHSRIASVAPVLLGRWKACRMSHRVCFLLKLGALSIEDMLV